MARKAFTSTEEQRHLVKVLSSYGIRQADIGTEVGLRSSISQWIEKRSLPICTTIREISGFAGGFGNGNTFLEWFFMRTVMAPVPGQMQVLGMTPLHPESASCTPSRSASWLVLTGIE
jgi:hypothetical protein